MEHPAQWAAFFRPFIVLIFFALIVIPIKLLIAKIWPDDKLPRLKNFLFNTRW